MAALTDDVEVTEKDGIKLSSPMAVDIIFRGALLMMNAAGFIAPAAAGAGNRFVGLSEAKVDNSGGSAGDKNAKYVSGGLAELTGTGLAQTDVGVKVYASDDQTVTKTFAANLVYVGTIEQFVSSTKVFVRMQMHTAVGEAAIADLGTTTLIPNVVTGGTPDNDAAAVDTALDTVETRLDNIEGKVDLMLAAMRRLKIIQG